MRILIFFILLFITTFYLLFSNNDINNIISNIKKIPFAFIGAGIALVLVYLLIEAWYIKITLNSLNTKFSFWQGFIF